MKPEIRKFAKQTVKSIWDKVVSTFMSQEIIPEESLISLKKLVLRDIEKTIISNLENVANKYSIKLRGNF